MDLETLKEKTLELIQKYPEYKDDFQDYFYLAKCEIEEGGSENHECELAYGDMLTIVEDITTN